MLWNIDTTTGEWVKKVKIHQTVEQQHGQVAQLMWIQELPISPWVVLPRISTPQQDNHPISILITW